MKIYGKIITANVKIPCWLFITKERKMKILMVNKFLYIKGGSETYVFKLSEYLKRSGHEIRYFGMLDERNIIPNDKKTMVVNVNFYNNSIKKVLNPLKIIYSHKARVKIRKIIKDFKPDIVHLNNYNYQVTPSILYEIAKFNIPIVQTVHDPNIICPSHKLYNCTNDSICEKCVGNRFYNCMLTRCIHGSFMKSLIGTAEAYTYHILHTYNKILYFICPSNFMSFKLIESGIEKKKVRVLHNFIENTNSMEFVKKDYVLYFGRISHEKGINTLLKSIKELNKIKFVFAGSGPLENELKGYENLEYVGFKKGDELTRLIGESLFSIISSEIYENCPMSVLESLSLSTPVIGSNIGGIPELIDNKCGLLFEAGNHIDLTDKIKYLYENREILSDFSANCGRSVEKFSIKKYYNSLIAIYNDAINSLKK